MITLPENPNFNWFWGSLAPMTHMVAVPVSAILPRMPGHPASYAEIIGELRRLTSHIA